MNEEDNINTMIVPDTEGDSMIALDYDNIIQVARRADEMVSAVKRIMKAALAITTDKDWVIIGGTPYLQESGCTKVSRLFGIGWKILKQWQTVNAEGYPTYYYRMAFTMGKVTIEAEGNRSADDDFFAKIKAQDGEGPRKKPVELIPLGDVMQAAYTNCLNHGIKAILPGLRNLEVANLASAGLHPENMHGYTFKTGSQGGNSGKAEDSGLVCSKCNAAITQQVASYSQAHYGAILCMSCQKKEGASQ